MSKLEKALELYSHFPKQDFLRELSLYMQRGYVYSDPNMIILFKPVSTSSANPINEWFKLEDSDAWYVHFALGKGYLKKLCEKFPVRLPFFGYSRILKNKPIRFHKSETFFRRVK